MELATGATVDRYVVEGVLGEGGMAIVYLCRHVQLGTKHALKLLTMSSRAIKERLVQEGQVQASLRHPNIVAVTDIIVVNGAPGLVMEYIEGPSLDDLLDQQTLTYEQADVLVEGLLRGVAHAHSRGLVHRDLKPANIMLAVEGEQLVPKVMDFGLAKLVEGDDSRTRTGSTMGTPQYMSPEQVEDSKNVDHRTDVFACGAILYEMVTGHRAFGGDSLYQIFGAVAEGKYRNPLEIRPDLPQRMVDAILGALTPDREERIQSIDELLAIWKGQTLRPGQEPAPAPAGPFSADFVKSVRSLTSEATPSQPEGTFALDPAAPVSVESLYKAPQAESMGPPENLRVFPTPPVPSPPPAPTDRHAGVPATSAVSTGAAVALGGGAVLLVVGVVALVGLVGLGAVYVMMASSPKMPDPVVVVVPGAPVPVAPVDPVAPVAPAQPVSTAPTPGGRPVPAPTAAPVAPSAPVPVVPATPDVPDTPDPPEEPDAPEAPDVPVPPGPAVSVEGLDSADPGTRIRALDGSWSNPALTARFVGMARTDSNRDVAVKAWQNVIRQYKAGVGDRSAQESLIIEAINTNVFSQAEAAATYGRVGTDPSVLLPVLRDGGLRAKNTAITAVVSVGQRGDRDAARRILQDELVNAKGPMRLRLEMAIGEL